MINSLNIGGYFYSELTSLNIGKVYPIVADNDAKYPFIVYKRVNFYDNGSKDGIIGDVAEVQVTIVTDKYGKGIEISNQVREKLEKDDVVFDDMLITETQLSNATEDFQNNAYIQQLQFKLTLNRI